MNCVKVGVPKAFHVSFTGQMVFHPEIFLSGKCFKLSVQPPSDRRNILGQLSFP